MPPIDTDCPEVEDIGLTAESIFHQMDVKIPLKYNAILPEVKKDYYLIRPRIRQTNDLILIGALLVFQARTKGFPLKFNH